MSGKDLNSSTITGGLERSAHRSLLFGLGLRREDLERPLIGIANSWTDMVPGHRHLNELAAEVREGICIAGGTPREFHTCAVCDGLAQGHVGMRYSLPSREHIADTIEIMARAHCFDGLVLLCACDKIIPGQLMGALRLDIPAIMVTGGCMAPGAWKDHRALTLSSMREFIGALRSGRLTEAELERIEESAIPGAGSCAMLGTANTMSLLAEAMGMSLPGMGALPALDAAKLRLARSSGERAVALVRDELTPRRIITAGALHNAIVADMALGGSTNSILHLLALADEAGVALGLDDFARISAGVPHLCDLLPGGSHPLVDFYREGGMPALMAVLEPLLDRNTLTVSGIRTGRLIAGWNAHSPGQPPGPVIRPLNRPLHPSGGLAILHGSLAPEGAVIKASAVEESELIMCGPARTFDCLEDAVSAVASGSIEQGTILVVRYEGPAGGPGMREMHMLSATLSGMESRCAVVTDGRFSGSSRDLRIGHVCPEAAAGGPIALVHDGDPIRIDVPSRRLDLLVTPAELASRRAEPPQRPTPAGLLDRYRAQVGSASAGAVLSPGGAVRSAPERRDRSMRMNRIIRINLTEGKITTEGVPRTCKLLGGRGLTSRIIHDEVPPEAEPTGPDNRLVIAPGLLAGTAMSSASRLSIGAKSPLTGGIKESNSGGTAAANLARLGIKAIIVEGRADRTGPLCLYLGKERAELHPFPHSFTGVYESARLLREEYSGKVSLILCGPAGEMGLAAAGIAVTDPQGRPSRYCGRGGLGAVLGGRGLKAVVIDPRGTDRPPYADRKAYLETTRELVRLLRENRQTGEIYPLYGTAVMTALTNTMHALPTRNFSAGTFEKAGSISGESLRSLIEQRGGAGRTTHACMPGCVIGCSNIFPDAEGNEIVGPLEYETIGLLGSNCGIGSLDEIARLNYLCNDLGLDTIETGAALGVAMEQGLLSFGDAAAAENLLKGIVDSTLAGRLIGGGALLTGRVLGSRRIPVVKGQAMPAYDPRAVKGFGVTFATSPMGADHTAGSVIRAPVDHTDPGPQPALSRRAQLNCMIVDCLGLCLFTLAALGGHLDRVAALVKHLTGESCDETALVENASRLLALELDFNRRAGFGPAHNRLPAFMINEPMPGLGTRFDVPDEALDLLHDPA